MNNTFNIQTGLLCRIRNIVAIAILFLLVFSDGTAMPVETMDVRGKVVRQAKQQEIPVTGIPVTLFNDALGRSKPSFTDDEGMYYLYNIPKGSYTLEVWYHGMVTEKYQPVTLDVELGPEPSTEQVKNRRFFDLEPVILDFDELY